MEIKSLSHAEAEAEQRQVSRLFPYSRSPTAGQQVRMGGTICHKERGGIRDEQACLKVMGVRVEM